MTLAAGALLLVAVLLAPDLTPAQAPTRGRGLMPADQALRTEALLARAFPGTTFDWERTQLVYPDGRRVAFTFSFYRERSRDGEVLVVASHAPDARAQAAVDQLQAFRTPAGEAPRCKLSVMRADAADNVLGYKETGFDVADAISTCDRVNFDYPYQSAGIPPPSGSAEPAWPLVLISVTTMHVLPDALAAIRWAAVLDTDTLGWVSRLPVSFNGKRRNGESATFFIENDRGAGGGAWIFSGIDGGAGPPRWRVRAPCAAARCKVEPQAVLAEAMQAVWRR